MLNDDVLREFTGKTKRVNYTPVSSRLLMRRQTMATKQARFPDSHKCSMGFLGGSVVKNPPASAGDTGLIPGEGNGNPLQYACLGNPMDRGAWQATVHGEAKESDTT